MTVAAWLFIDPWTELAFWTAGLAIITVWAWLLIAERWESKNGEDDG